MASAQDTARSGTIGDTGVLIVDDECSARIASERYLDYCGYRVSAAANADEAYELAAHNPPDVVVCDWRLQERGGDGVEVAGKLQQRYACAVVFVTAYPLDDLRNAANDIDVARYLRKPFSLVALANTIASLADREPGDG